MFDLEIIQKEMELSDEKFDKIKWIKENIEGNEYFHGRSEELIVIVNSDDEIVELKENG